MIGNISVGKRISKEEMLKTQEKEKPKVPVCISWLFLESILSFCFFVLFYVHFRHSPRDMFFTFFLVGDHGFTIPTGFYWTKQGYG